MKKLLGGILLTLITTKVIADRIEQKEFDENMTNNINRNKEIMREI
jgi:hypothetical protein